MGRDEQRLKLQRSVAANLEQTLYTLDGVREARVHINLPERDPLLGREITPGSASVLIIFEGSKSINKEDVAQLVSGAAGIPLGSVSVLCSKVETPSLPILANSAELPGPDAAATVTAPIRTHPVLLKSDPLTEIALSLVVLGLAGAYAVLRKNRKPVAATERA